MDISRIGKPPQESQLIHTVQELNQALCSVVLLLANRPAAKRSLSYQACLSLSKFIAQQSRELLKAELFLRKQGGSHE